MLTSYAYLSKSLKYILAKWTTTTKTHTTTTFYNTCPTCPSGQVSEQCKDTCPSGQVGQLYKYPIDNGIIDYFANLSIL